MKTNEFIIGELAKFLRNETLNECPIKIISRESIENEDAELVRFSYGEYEESCISIVYADGSTYTPNEWVTHIWDNQDWKINDSDWVDCNYMHCTMSNGMPRRLTYKQNN